MSRVLTAFRAFFAALFNRETAGRIEKALIRDFRPAPESIPQSATTSRVTELPIPVAQKPRQSEAITLLASLQREARLVDFLKEDLSDYSDEQVGAAVREIHRESRAVLDRVFEICPILGDDEGTSVEIPRGFDAARYRLTGKPIGNAPYRGTLRHHGWEATKCDLPEFVGGQSATKTIAPAEVEVQ